MKSISFKVSTGILLAMLLPQLAHAAEVVIISHPGTIIQAREITEVFLGEKQFAGSIKLIPIDNAALQANFLPKALKMDVKKYNNIWTKKSFRDGLIPPVVKVGDTEVIDFVTRTPGAIGYVSSSPNGLNVVR